MRTRMYLLFILLITSIDLLNAQEYLIRFEGSGESLTVNTVIVENLTQGTSLTMNGNNTLHLMTTVTGIETITGSGFDKIDLYPNPMTDFTKMTFTLYEPAVTRIELFDNSGRKILQEQEFLYKGTHTFYIRNIPEGKYFVRICSGKYSKSGILISTAANSISNKCKIEYAGYKNTDNTFYLQKESFHTKSTNTEVIMQYDTGDRLKFTGISGIYSNVITDVPTDSKSITFNFIDCTDGDNNHYVTVQVGNQVWMAENLKTTTYKDGTPIDNITDGNEWANLTIPAYCWFSNDTENRDIYGGLYNWYVVETGNLCPSGWHVPGDDEWHQLILFLDVDASLESEIESRIAADKLKEPGTENWNYPNAGTDEVGFKALPGGYRKYTGMFAGTTDNGNWRTSTKYDETHVWYRFMFTNSGDIYRKMTNMQAGYSVRCIKD